MIKTAIHNVFIAKENILWLEEWIDYHSQLGFDQFYLYDNSKVQTKSWWERRTKNEHIKPGKTNKHGWNFNKEVPLNKKQIDSILEDISAKYPGVHFIEWSPMNGGGRVKYAQSAAHGHCARRLKKINVDWCASIDMDEFLVIEQGKKNNIKKYLSELDDAIGLVRIRQTRFKSRSKNHIELVTKILKSKKPLKGDKFRKYIYRPSITREFTPHHARVDPYGRWYNPRVEELSINHYREEDTPNFETENINYQILKKIELNQKNYIINEYIK